MRLRALLLAVTLAVAAPTAAQAKEGVRATLVTPIPLDATPGERLTVRWKLAYAVQSGVERPFNAIGVFVRLDSATGAASTEGFASETDHSSGDYEATVVVPQGGIADVEIGLQGWSSPGGRSDAMFPIANDPLPGDPIVAAVAPAPAAPAEDRVILWSAVALGGAAVMLLLLAPRALAVVRRRGRDFTSS